MKPDLFMRVVALTLVPAMLAADASLPQPPAAAFSQPVVPCGFW